MKSHYDFCRENRGIKENISCCGKIEPQLYFDSGVKIQYFDEICYGCPYFVENANS